MSGEALQAALRAQDAGDHAGALARLLPTLRGTRPNGRGFLFAGLSLQALGRADEAAKLWDLGASVDPAVRMAWRHPRADARTRAASARADRAVRAALSGLHRDAAAGAGRAEDAVWLQTHDAPLPTMDGGARPHVLFVPGLPDRATFEGLDWMDALARRAEAVRAEFLRVRSRARSAPYVAAGMRDPAWTSLRGVDDWSAVTLFAGGTTEQASLFPEAVRALEEAPVTRLNGVPVEAFFSVLRPGTRIPPHRGLSNARLTVHLPLVVPPGDCAIRVGDARHRWREGTPFAFDDSWEHEAWNETPGERAVLIFEAWRPELTAAERAGLERSYAARAAWLADRRVPSA